MPQWSQTQDDKQNIEVVKNDGLQRTGMYDQKIKNYKKGNLDELETGTRLVDIDWIIKHQFLDPVVKKSDDFQNISTTKGIEMKNFIRQVIKYDGKNSLPHRYCFTNGSDYRYRSHVALSLIHI